jgi:hypothetical protein
MKRPNQYRMTVLIPGYSQQAYEATIKNGMMPAELHSMASLQGQKLLLEQASRGDYSLAGASMIVASDGKTLWAWNSQQGRIVRPGTPPAPAFDWDGPYVDYQAKGHKLELQGRGKAAGRDCFKVRVTTTDSVSTRYIDAETFLEVVVEAKAKNSPLTGRTEYRDWKPVDGIMVAHSVRSRAMGAGARTIHQSIIDKVEFNVPLDDARFAPPADKQP